MKQVIFRYGALLVCILSTAHCSSLKKSAFQMFLKKVKDKKDTSVQFLPPPPPYKKQTHPQLDALWQNPETNSYLSYFSNCSKNIQSLEEIERGTLSEIENYKLIKTKKTKNHIYSVIKIYHSTGEQTISGMRTFKKENCFYILNLMADSKKSFEEETPIFQKFIKEFQPK